MLTVGSLFAGIGGFDLGLERAGMRSVWQCEIDPYAIRVLEKHWPDVLRVPDIRDVGARTVPYVDVIAGGFPCQDISSAGAKVGIGGARSGLWWEYARVVGELRPRYVVVENVRDLLARGLDTVLGSLAEIGYDAEWDCIPAAAIGAPHRRDRIWLVAYPNGEGQPHGSVDAQAPGDAPAAGRGDVANAESERCKPRPGAGEAIRAGQPEAIESQGRAALLPGPGGSSDYWLVEPDVGRVAHGVPARMDRLRAVGNSLVPQIAEWIGRRILAYEGAV